MTNLTDAELDELQQEVESLAASEAWNLPVARAITELRELRAEREYHDECGYSCWETDVNVGRICAYCAMAEDLTAHLRELRVRTVASEAENERLRGENTVLMLLVMAFRDAAPVVKDGDA